MKILALGDVVGRPGRDIIAEKLPGLIAEHDVSFVVANGENTAAGSGMTPDITKALLESGLIVGAKIVVHMKMPKRQRDEERVVDGVSVKKKVGYAEVVLTMICDFSKMRSQPH